MRCFSNAEAGWRGKGKNSREQGLNLFSSRETGPREPESLERAALGSVNENPLRAKGKRQKAKGNVSLSACARSEPRRGCFC